MEFISLFSGIGGFDLGFERAGMQCVAQVEIDPFCQRVLAKHWPNVLRYGDIHNVGKHNLPTADVICGGFPCQPHSLAGKRRGAEDDRDLWPEYFRIVEELRPTWVVGENVPGIRTTILDKVLSDLESLEYSTVTLDIPAIAFDAPHRRHRYFIVAHSKSGNRNLSAIAREQEETFHAGGNGSSQYMADSNLSRLEEWQSKPGNNGTKQQTTIRGNWWSVEPSVGRVAHGVPNRVDRLRSLGNALVPQVAEFIGQCIVQSEMRVKSGV
jgi:DNA (cytosine-5)-methyltransferase 1